MQKHIAAWERLAAFALAACIEWCFSVHEVQSPVVKEPTTANAASAKKLSMTRAMSVILGPFFKSMRRFQIFLFISHIPGHFNVVADVSWRMMVCSSPNLIGNGFAYFQTCTASVDL